ncbi:hypothetical protein AB0D58_35380 [Streptomyces sp. NPDC048210]
MSTARKDQQAADQLARDRIAASQAASRLADEARRRAEEARTKKK